MLSLALVPFICQALPLATATGGGFDFPIMPSIASLTPGTISAPPREASIVPPHCRAIIPGSNEERLSLRGALTDTSPTHLSTNQTPGVGSHIELRAASVKLRRRHIAASLSLFLSFPSLPIYLCHLIISDRASFVATCTRPVSALHMLPCICVLQPTGKV